MRQNFRDHRSLGSKLSRIAVNSTVGLAVLMLLAIPAQLPAQSCQTSGYQQYSESVEPRDSNACAIPDLRLGLDARASSTADGILPASELPTETQRSNPFVVDVGLFVAEAHCADCFFASTRFPYSVVGPAGRAADGDRPAVESKPASVMSRNSRTVDRNSSIYYRNRLEFGLDVGWHSVNIPFVYDFAVGDSYLMTPLKYTLVPIIASLRWHVTDVGWPWVLRGNFDFTFSGSVTAIPRGPETRYFSFMFGIRRNFVHRNWKVVPYFDQRGGIGEIDAKEPLGILYGQGQNLTFTYAMGAGVRYNFDSKYSFSAGMNYMHVSNGYLSEPKFTNYGINVYGPMFGIDVRLGKPHRNASE